MEKRMIKKMRKKDTKGLDYVINAYSKNVYFLVDKIIGYYGKEEVEECVSDAFFTIWNSIEDYDEKRGKFSTFIYMKTKFKALDYKRRLEKYDKDDINIDENITNKISTEEIIIDKEKTSEIINIINNFKEPDKTYFYLKYFMYYKIEEIAEKYETTRSSVENRLYRCRLKIKDFLEGGFTYEG